MSVQSLSGFKRREEKRKEKISQQIKKCKEKQNLLACLSDQTVHFSCARRRWPPCTCLHSCSVAKQKNKRKQTIKKGKGRRSTFARLRMNGGRKTSQLGCFSKSFTSLRMWFGQRITLFIVSWQGKTPRWNEAPVANHPERGADSLRNIPKNVESAKSTPDRLCHRAKPPLSR